MRDQQGGRRSDAARRPRPVTGEVRWGHRSVMRAESGRSRSANMRFRVVRTRPGPRSGPPVLDAGSIRLRRWEEGRSGLRHGSLGRCRRRLRSVPVISPMCWRRARISSMSSRMTLARMVRSPPNASPSYKESSQASGNLDGLSISSEHTFVSSGRQTASVRRSPTGRRHPTLRLRLARRSAAPRGWPPTLTESGLGAAEPVH